MLLIRRLKLLKNNALSNANPDCSLRLYRDALFSENRSWVLSSQADHRDNEIKKLFSYYFNLIL
jgi:hypothetical protein